MIYLRHGGRLLGELLLLAWRSGRWWVPVVTVVLGVAVVAALTAKAVVGPTVYVLF